MIKDRDIALLGELDPTIEFVYERHRSRQKGGPINPVELLGDAAGDPTYRRNTYGPYLEASLQEHLARLDEAGLDARPTIAGAFIVNVLTEDNLPHYVKEIHGISQHSERLSAWLNHIWAPEEDGHGLVMRDYGLDSNLIGKVIPQADYHAGRVSQLRSGMDIQLEEITRSFAYLSLQEMATYEAHNNLSTLLDKPGNYMMRRISGQEINHARAYTDLENALLDIDPDTTVLAIKSTFDDFGMPGRHGIPGFAVLEQQLALAGILDKPGLTELKAELIKKWNIADREFTSDEAKSAQAELVELLDAEKRHQIGRVAAMDRLRLRAVEQAKTRKNPVPVILGMTVKLEAVDGQRLLVPTDLAA